MLVCVGVCRRVTRRSGDGINSAASLFDEGRRGERARERGDKHDHDFDKRRGEREETSCCCCWISFSLSLQIQVVGVFVNKGEEKGFNLPRKWHLTRASFRRPPLSLSPSISLTHASLHSREEREGERSMDHNSSSGNGDVE